MTDLTQVTLVFSEVATGELAVDEVEFSLSRSPVVIQFTYRRPVRLQVTAEEVLREFGKRARTSSSRSACAGTPSPSARWTPVARIEAGRRVSEALFTEVVDDERGMRAYFATDVRLEGNLVVGYGDEVTAVIPLGRVRGNVTRLDPERIEGPHHRVTAKDLCAFRRGR